MKQYTIISNKESLEQYRKHYFKMHPRAKKFPIESPIHPSMNKWIKLQSFKQDALKQAWGDYAQWLVEVNGYKDLQLDGCIGYVKVFRPTKRRFDADNISPKFLLDGIVKAGMLVDDDVNHLNPLILYGDYDKNDPRMEIIFEEKDIDENIV